MIGGGIAAALLAVQASSRSTENDVDHTEDHWHYPSYGVCSAMPYRCETAVCGYVDTKEDLYT